MSSVARERVGVASGINNAVSRAAGLLAIAVLGIVMLHTFNRSLGSHLAKLDIPPSIRQFLHAERGRLAGVEFSESIPTHTRALLADAINRSFVAGFRWVMLIGSGLALGSAATALLFIRRNSEPLVL